MWKPEILDSIFSVVKQGVIIDNNKVDNGYYPIFYSQSEICFQHKKDILPLLDIAQMQSFILEKTECLVIDLGVNDDTSTIITFGDETTLYGTELCDVFWEAIKQILEWD